ncbi:MAG: DUF4236 domain-containing protein [Bacilli bacterium]|nr:DUF4236 domain-containing protein [Bacilli bacterium]
MASWSFRRRIKIIPGVRLNFSRGGISTSIGIRGANFTFGKDGTYLNTGIPGTGIYKRQKISSSSKLNNSPRIEENNNTNHQPTVEQKDNIFSVEPDKITSQNMEGVKQSIIDAHNQRKELVTDIERVEKDLLWSKVKLFFAYLFIIGFVYKKIVEEIKLNIIKQKESIAELEKQRNESYVQLDTDFDKDASLKYENVLESFKELMKMEKIWDITREEENDKTKTRSSASRAIERKDIKIELKDLEDIKYNKQALCFCNANGADLYFYPSFIVMQGKDNFGVIGLDEVEFSFNSAKLIEQEKVPKDSEIIEYTWFKVNKNGQPDKRFKDNYQIPVVKYGVINLKTNNGLNEEYQFSNYLVSEKFANAFLEFKNKYL